MKNLLLDILLTAGITGFVVWRWSIILPRVLRAVQPVATQAMQRQQELDATLELIDQPAP